MQPTAQNLDPAHEDALIRRVQQGDLAAFEPLVDRYLPLVRAFLALRTPAAHLVDELAHETFVHAFRHMAEFRAGTALGAWLRAIAGNLMRAEILRFSREQTQQTRYAQARRLDLAQQETDPSQSQEAEFLSQCLEALPDGLRRLVTLKYHEDMSSEEIAGRLQRSTAWVWTSLFRVRQQLRDCIQRKREGRQPC